ncbi:hypothetical protein GBA63_11085 [Rubrobacter tropicus]|uniref:Uncharacterized protein n=1 Tax=Rubrobacter tropicus TaxID=2653851 RepID=A0A6G8Q9Z1_9ACTN|nr:hypothetical protein [Rubrobacter tropicus]QIN83127.1 hypothetical protein GBA63_11085 [Rubrobacter tropicus]
MSGTKRRTGDRRKSARAVAMSTFDFDAEAPILAEDLWTMSRRAHGPKVGVPRNLDFVANLEGRT